MMMKQIVPKKPKKTNQIPQQTHKINQLQEKFKNTCGEKSNLRSNPSPNYSDYYTY